MPRSDSVDVGPRDIFLDSLNRCEGTEFFDRFYERFLASSSEVRDKFKYTDFDRQRRMLRRSLQLIASATAGDPAGLRELNDRAETHRRANLDIPPRLYDVWLDVLVTTATEFDAKWTAEVEAAWRTILGIAIRHMTRRYDD